MTTPCEYTLAEKPCIDALVDMDYTWLPPSQNDRVRDGQNQVILRDVLIQAIQRINNVSEEVARGIYHAVTRSRIMNCYMLPLSFGVILLRYASAVTLGCNALRTIWRQLKD